MKIRFHSLLCLLFTIPLATFSAAQSADPRLEWANRVVAAQQGPELDHLVEQLVASAVQDLITQWKPKFEARVPKARRAQLSELIDRELQKFAANTQKILNRKTGTISYNTFAPAYMSRFSLDELKQLLAFLESPVIKKYQSIAPELGEQFVQQLVEAARPDIQALSQEFDRTASIIISSKSSKR